jgi:hypothetical protein
MSRSIERLQAIAARQGWRLVWRTTDWQSYGWKLRVLDIFSGSDRIGGGTCTFRSSDGPNNAASENVAEMILSGLRGRGAEGDRVGVR